MNRPPLAGLARLVLGLAACAGASAAVAQPLPPLVVTEYDTVRLKDDEHGLVGHVVDKLPDGTIKFQQLGTNNIYTIPPDKYVSIERKQTASDAVKKHGGGALAADDFTEVRKTIRWGIDHDAAADAIALGRQALAKRSSTDIGELVIEALLKGGDADGAVQICSKLLETSPQWTQGYETLAKIYLDQKRDADLRQLVAVWLDRQPTALTPNRFLAASAEAAGDLRTAQEAYRKGFDLHHDWEAGLGYARTSLKRGNRADAQVAAEALIAAGQFVDDARAIAGMALLGQGAPEKAEPLLTQALAGSPGAEMADLARYDLGVISYRAGKASQARAMWSASRSPAAELALAMLDGRPFEREDIPPWLKGVAAEYNAGYALSRQRFADAAKLVDPKGSRREQFLALLSTLKTPTDEAVRQLAQIQGAEALRWQAYALVQMRRWQQVESVLAQLPADDGWAAVVRVYIAEAQKDRERAKELYARVASTKDAPADYVAILEREYANSDNQVLIERFDAAETELVNRGWTISVPGTGIAMRTDGGALVFEGTQAASQDPINRAGTDHPAAALRSLQVSLDLSAAGGATAGIELLDAEREQGYAYGAYGDNKLGWRQLRKGAWGAWTDLPVGITGSVATLRLEIDKGQVFAVPVEDPAARRALGTAPGKDQPVTATVFATGEVGSTWRVAFREYQVELKSAAGTPKK